MGFYTLKRYNHFSYHNLYELTDKSLFDANRRLAWTEILPLSLYDTTGTVEHSESRVPTEWGKMTCMTRLQFYTAYESGLDSISRGVV